MIIIASDKLGTKYNNFYEYSHNYILQIDQKVDTEWPLTVKDHKGKKDKVYLKKGEMVIYESAKIIHGRQFPLNGDYFENLFIHFTIKKDYKKYQAIKDYVWSKEP